MNIGICSLEIFIYDVNSLKEKRSVIKSLINKSKNKFNISIAEVGDNDKWNRSIIGFSCVSNDTKLIDKVIESEIKFILGNFPVEILNTNREILYDLLVHKKFKIKKTYLVFRYIRDAISKCFLSFDF